jgi:hypothetical protein
MNRIQAGYNPSDHAQIATRHRRRPSCPPQRRNLRHSVHLLPAAHVQRFTGDVGRPVGGEIRAGMPYVGGRLRPAQRNAAQERLRQRAGQAVCND